MLGRDLLIEEIARPLRRDHGEVRDKVVVIGRACRAEISARKRDSIDTIIGDHSNFEEG